MSPQKTAQIIAAYDLFDDDDISTERLLQQVADHCGCDVGDVAEALQSHPDAK